MAVVKLHHINIQTLGKYPVIINGIDLLHHDCIIGEVNTPSGGPTPTEWDLSGLARNSSPNQCNLDMSDPEMKELAALINKWMM